MTNENRWSPAKTSQWLSQIAKLTRDERQRHYNHIIKQALPQYGITESRTVQIEFLRSMLVCSGGATFSVTTNQQKYVFRIHNPVPGPPDEYNDKTVIESVLQWLQALDQDTDLTIQKPVKNTSNQFTTEVPDKSGETIKCTLLCWVDGEIVKQRTISHFHQIGAVMGKLHLHTSQWQKPATFVRPQNNVNKLNTHLDTLTWAKDAKRISSKEFNTLNQTVHKIKEQWSTLGKDPSEWGPIHGDLGFGSNCVFHNGQARPIDFHGCSQGHHLYEIAHTLRWIKTPENRNALLNGYQTIRPLPHRFNKMAEALYLASEIGHLSGYVQNPTESLESERRFIQQHCPLFLENEPFLFLGD